VDGDLAEAHTQQFKSRLMMKGLQFIRALRSTVGGRVKSSTNPRLRHLEMILVRMTRGELNGLI
jgi:hypothetical protein